jgi:long-chain fatty acid transport protein
VGLIAVDINQAKAGRSTVNHNRFLRFVVVVVAIIVFLPVNTHASGFRLPESSIAGMSLSNAVVANTDAKGAIIYNPAIMSMQEDRRLLSFAFMNVNLKSHVDPQVGTATDSQGDDSIWIPNFYYTSKVSKKWAWGIGLQAPFGLETKWPAGTFGLFNTLGVSALEPEQSKIEVANLTPNVSFLINENNSISFGVNYYDVRNLTFNTQDIQIDGSGDDFGYTLGYLYKRGNWGFGATYRSEVNVTADGSIAAGGTSADASAELSFPAILQIGLRNQINQKFALEFDIERTYWSSFDTIEINHQHPGQSFPPTDPRYIPNPITSTNNWKDSNAYRLAGSYQLTSAWQLRFGYALDETPQPDDYFTARIPDADRQLFSFGVSYKPNSWEFEAGIMYVKFDNRTINQPSGSYQSRLQSGDTDPNGTDAFNGTYESNATLIGLGFTKTFMN